MTTWILILTLLGSTSQSGQAIAVIPGFKSLAECQAVGSVWLREAKFGAGRPTAVCAEQTK